MFPQEFPDEPLKKAQKNPERLLRQQLRNLMTSIRLLINNRDPEVNAPVVGRRCVVAIVTVATTTKMGLASATKPREMSIAIIVIARVNITQPHFPDRGRKEGESLTTAIPNMESRCYPTTTCPHNPQKAASSLVCARLGRCGPAEANTGCNVSCRREKKNWMNTPPCIPMEVNVEMAGRLIYLI